MAEIQTISADQRDRAGKGVARAIRREGKIPAVIYGGKQEATSISLEVRALEKEYSTGKFLNTLYNIEVAGKEIRVIPRDVQIHPVTDKPLHVDFLRLAEGAQITLMIPVNFLNEEDCEGLAKGGVLNVVRYEVEMNVPADNIPEAIEGDLAGLDIGGSLHISAFKMPEGCAPTITDRDFTVATIAAPSDLETEEETVEDEEGLEGEEGVEGAEAAEGEEAEGESE